MLRAIAIQFIIVFGGDLQSVLNCRVSMIARCQEVDCSSCAMTNRDNFLNSPILCCCTLSYGFTVVTSLSEKM